MHTTMVDRILSVFQAIVVTESALRAGNELGVKHIATAEDCGAKRRK